MVVLAIAVTVSMEKRPDSKQGGRVKISVRPKPVFRKWPETVNRVDGRISTGRKASDDMGRLLLS